MSKKILIIDGNALIHRAFHAIPPLTNADGQPTNAIYGFMSMLLNLLIKERPDYITVTYDKKGKTFRDEIYTEYKATRVHAPQELYDQMPKIKELVEKFRIPQFEKEGFEADDIIATIARQIEREHDDIAIYVVTGDRDTMQLVTDRIKILTPQNGFKDYKIYDTKTVTEEFGVTPAQFRDYKALRGDISDNIPGIRGIGEKTAASLLQAHHSIDGIYAHLAELPETTRKKLEEGHAGLEQGLALVTLIDTVPVDFDLDACKTHTFDLDALRSHFEHYQFRSLFKKLDTLAKEYDHERKAETNASLPLLFD